MRRIIIPQGVRVMVPNYMSNATLLLKATSLATVIGVTELTGRSRQLANSTFKPIEILTAAGVIYLVISLLAGFAALNDPELAVAGPTVAAHPLSLAFQLGNEGKRDAIDAVLNEMIADGTLAEIQTAWFGRCIPVPDEINEEGPYTTFPTGDC